MAHVNQFGPQSEHAQIASRVDDSAACAGTLQHGHRTIHRVALRDPPEIEEQRLMKSHAPSWQQFHVRERPRTSRPITPWQVSPRNELRRDSDVEQAFGADKQISGKRQYLEQLSRH